VISLLLGGPGGYPIAPLAISRPGDISRLSGTDPGSQGPQEAEEGDVIRTEQSDWAAQEEEPELPPRLAAVLDHLEDVAAARDDELTDVLSRITPLPVEQEEQLQAQKRTA
jgi:hypothetical protein